MKNYKKKIKIDIRGQKWNVYLFTLENYHSELGEDSRAITEVENFDMYFSEDYLTLPIIRHELTHAMIESYAHYNAELTNPQLEEILCTIMEVYYEYIQELALTIFKKLKGRKR